MAEQAGTFGSYLDEDILKQIEVRQNIQGRKTPAGRIQPFSEKDYQVLHSNAPWVCLRSSVNAPRVNSWKPGQGNSTTDSTARKYILCGGTLEYSDGKLSFATGPVISNNSGTPGYIKDSVMGYRPKPGITGVVVKTKDTFGCIQEADIDFMVYSIDELELVDQIYFKPGMTALLEWGHTIYHDSRGNIHPMTVSDLYSFDKFFSTETFEVIEEDVQNWRKFHKSTSDVSSNEKFNETGFCGNYEALYGYITNFSYSLNTNGSYTCKVKLLSKGSILEGLQIPSNSRCGLVRNTGEKEEKNQKGGESEDQTSNKTPFHLIFNQAKQYFQEKNDRADDYLFTGWAGQFSWAGDIDEYRFCGKNMIQQRGFLRRDVKVPMVYLRLSTFLHIVNRVVKAANIDNVKFNTRPLQENDEEIYTGMPYVSFSEHFSLNPGVVVLPCKATIREGDSYTDKDKLLVSFVLDQTDAGLPVDSLAGRNNIIADLWVNVDFILGIIDGIVDNDTQTYSVKRLIEGVLEGIQKAMGNVNSFGVQFNEVTNMYDIVDRNCVASEAAAVVEKGPVIQVSGTDTVITNLSVNSEVSSEVANEMSIAATAPNDGTSIANIDQVFWNEGCIDRHRIPETGSRQEKYAMLYLPGYKDLQPDYSNLPGPVRADSSTRTNNSNENPPVISYETSKDFLDAVSDLYRNFSGRNATEEATGGEQSFCEYVESAFGNIQLDGETLFKRCVNRDAMGASSKEGAESTSSYFQSGIIPIKVGFTIKGIGRFIIGTTFQISEGLVPRKYRNWRNIITGVEHKIEPRGWTTTVSALYYPVLAKAVKPDGIPSSTRTGEPEELDASSVGEAVEQPKNAVEAFFRYFWKHKQSISSQCAAYVAMMAKSWVGDSLALEGGWGNAGFVNPKTGVSCFAEKAAGLGWKYDSKLCKKDVSRTEVEQVVNQVTNDGDIVIYYWKNPNVKKENGYLYYYWLDKSGHRTCQHVQMKMPQMKLVLGEGGSGYAKGTVKNVDSTWTTSNFQNYGCRFVYGNKQRYPVNPDKWDVWVLHAPKINDTWRRVR